MLAAISRLRPAAARFSRQIVPPVVATLIAAGLISAYNRAFSGYLQQPRLSALHYHDPAEVLDEPEAKPLAPTVAVATYETIAPPPRLWEKESGQESAKDQAIKVAEPAPPRPGPTRLEKAEARAEQRRVAAIEPAPAVRAPSPVAAAPVIVGVLPPAVAPPAVPAVVPSLPTVQELRQPVLPPPPPQYAQPQVQQPAYQPPPVVTAQPLVTAPDRRQAIEQAQADAPNPPQGPLGKIVDTLKPSNLFARAREFGEKIEQAGNDILPNIRR